MRLYPRRLHATPFTLALSFTLSDVLALIPLLALGGLVYVFVLVGWLVYRLTHPPRRTVGVAIAQGRPADPSELTPSRVFTSFACAYDGATLPAWDVPGDDASGPVCVMTHGFGDSKLGALTRLAAVVGECSRVIVWDMPGHGEAGGTCKQGTSEVLALEAVLATLPVGSRVILFGWSLGAGVSLVAAVRSYQRAKVGLGTHGGLHGDHAVTRIVGLVLESPYTLAITPARNVLRSFGMPTGFTLQAAMWFVGHGLPRELSLRDDAFDRVSWAEKGRLEKANVPVLVLHGELDHVSPVADAHEIAAACRGELVIVPGGGHFGLWTNEESGAGCKEAVVKAMVRWRHEGKR